MSSTPDNEVPEVELVSDDVAELELTDPPPERPPYEEDGFVQEDYEDDDE